MFTIDTKDKPSVLFGHNSRWLQLCLFGMFLLATLIRLDEIKAPGHLLDREYTSAIFARAYYFTNNDQIEPWRREIALTAKEQQPVLEPPLLEFLVSLIYRITGRDELHYARYLTNAFWLIGGIFIFLIVKKLLSTDEAFIATAYYLFVPMGIIISRSFQPDSLMMMFFLISLYLLVLYFDVYSTKHLLAAAILTGITLLLRPLVIFAIFCAFLAFSIHRSQNWKKIIDRPLIIFSVASLLPSILYYGYGIVFAGFMRWKISTSFMPYLLVRKDFWLGWFDNVVGVAEVTPLLLAIIGFFLVRNRQVQYLIIGLALGFMLFSVIFTYHIHTHPYYHIQLFPIIGICLAAVMTTLMTGLKVSAGRMWWLPILVVGSLALGFSYREVRDSLHRVHSEDPAVAREIGTALQHSDRVVFVSFYYGLPLEYYGEFAGAPWPVRIENEFYRRPGETELSVAERIAGLRFEPAYFVITHFNLYQSHHADLKAYLENNCHLLEQTDRYLIYDLCQPTTADLKAGSEN